MSRRKLVCKRLEQAGQLIKWRLHISPEGRPDEGFISKNLPVVPIRNEATRLSDPRRSLAKFLSNQILASLPIGNMLLPDASLSRRFQLSN